MGDVKRIAYFKAWLTFTRRLCETGMVLVVTGLWSSTTALRN